MNRSTTNINLANSSISIPEDELVFVTARSSGPGGQNVNKIETKVRLIFHFKDSRALTEGQKMLLSRSRSIQASCNPDGAIVITSQQHRSQIMNRAEAKKRLVQLIATALKPAQKRIKTKPTLASKRRRLDSKIRRGVIKSLRRVDF